MNIPEFVRESNRIEGIHREPSRAEIEALDAFISLDCVSIGDLQAFVEINQPGAVLRDRPGLDVRVGNHFPPRGGPEIREALQSILDGALAQDHPYLVHCAYEFLHPFTDGNGRSGRALWAWGMWQAGATLNRLFLHEFYYQTLQHFPDGRVPHETLSAIWEYRR